MSEEQKPLTKAEWYQRIRQEGKTEVIKEEMIRLGFWTEKPLPPEEAAIAAEEEKQRKALRKELDELRRESAKLGNMKQLIKEARQKRIEESKKRRAEQKKAREIAQKKAKERWQEYQKTHLIHLGDGVSGGLESKQTDYRRLQEQGLPIIHSPLQLAHDMRISLSRLKWLTYHRKAATISHYYHFQIPKKKGGLREISSPKQELRQAQQWIKENILDHLPVHSAAYGFVPGRNTVDHAKIHVKQAIVVKMDLQDFFPTITFFRVRGLFESFGYSRELSTIFALICTEPPRQKVEFDGRLYYVAIGDRQLPQGACTSPAITNLICHRLDERLFQLAKKERFIYSRYADDLTFSTPQTGNRRLGALLQTAQNIIQYEGFSINHEKTRVLRSSEQQKVTGIVVNEKPNISRKERRRFRAILHNVEKNGITAENRENHPDFWGFLQGYVSYAMMVQPEIGKKWQSQLYRIANKHLYVNGSNP